MTIINLKSLIMNQLKNKVLGTIALVFFLAGLANAAESVDPSKNQSVEKQEIKEFAAYCSNGGDPR